MRYDEDATGSVQLTLTGHEAQKLEDFIHLAAMSLMTWPVVAGDYMTTRKEWRNLNLPAASKDGAGAGPDS